MKMYDIISKKRHGKELDGDEINFFINGYTAGSIPDYQASALLMAIAINGLNDNETAALTAAMASSGDTINLSCLGKLSVDKHSTGGVGDKTTIIVAPIVAACGGKLAKMSGRGLGHTGGTVDKLEAISGYKTTLEADEFISLAKENGIVVIGQSGNLAPADKKLYALRDVTATVDSIPLIVSSIMSKKLAAGSKNIVLDVKVGSGAFMKDLKSATVLAEKMVEIGKKCGRNTAALLSNMDKPLGSAIGNSIEVKEAVSVLKNETKGELRELCLSLSATMLELCLGVPFEKALSLSTEALNSGRALEKFKEWIASQGGNTDFIKQPDLLKAADYCYAVVARESGYISRVNTEKIGVAAGLLGAGRAKKEDKIDFAAGIELQKTLGDRVEKGDIIAILYANEEKLFEASAEVFEAALEYSPAKTKASPLVYKIIK